MILRLFRQNTELTRLRSAVVDAALYAGIGLTEQQLNDLPTDVILEAIAGSARLRLMRLEHARQQLQASAALIDTLTDALPAASAVLSDDTMTTIDDAIARYRAA